MTRATPLLLLAPLVAAQSLDYETYKSKVEPIFLKKRPGHARCVACHVDAATAFKLQPLPEGARQWTEEQSRKNFEMTSRIVNRLLIHPLARDAGGDVFHAGGRQFASKEDPDWKTIAAWASKTQ